MPTAGVTRRPSRKVLDGLPDASLTEAPQPVDASLTGSELSWLPGVRQQSCVNVDFAGHNISSLR